MTRITLEFDHPPSRIMVDGVEWKPEQQPPKPEPRPQPSPPRVSPVPADDTPIKPFTEDGLQFPHFDTAAKDGKRRVASFRPFTYPLDDPSIAEYSPVLIWGSNPNKESTLQLREHAPHVKIPGYILETTALSTESLNSWQLWCADNSYPMEKGILAAIPDSQRDGSEQAWANVFDDTYRQWAFERALKKAERFDGLLFDMAFNPNVNKNKTGNRHWQHAAGSLMREIYRQLSEGKIVCANVSRWKAQQYEVLARYVAGLYLDRCFIKPELDDNDLWRQCVENERIRKTWPDYWSIQDSWGRAGAKESPGYKMGDYCRYLLRMATLGGWQEKHFFACCNNDAGAGSHSRIFAHHWVPACLVNLGEPKDEPYWWNRDEGVLTCSYERGEVYARAAVKKSYQYLPPYKLSREGRYIGFDGSEVRAVSWELGPGEGVIVKR